MSVIADGLLCVLSPLSLAHNESQVSKGSLPLDATSLVGTTGVFLVSLYFSGKTCCIQQHVDSTAIFSAAATDTTT